MAISKRGIDSTRWDRFYLKLKQFYDEHGHCYVGYGGRDRALRAWCDEQCQAFRQGRLDSAHLQALEALKFDFQAFGGHWRSWWLHYEELKAYVATNGHANVPQRVERIGPWLCAQRVQYRRGGVPENRRKLLEQIGVDWAPAERLDVQWQEQFARLKQHFEKYGSLDQVASAWISAQRTAYRKKILPPHRVQLLESIQFKWSARA